MSELETSAPVIDTAPEPAGSPPVAETPASAARPSLDDTLSAAWDKIQVNGVERAENGQFKSDKPIEAVQPPAEPEPPKPVVEAPQSWTAERKAEWSTLPPTVQEYILQREGEAHKAITSNGERLKSYEPIDRVITQFRPDYERRGLTFDKASEALFNAQRMLDQNPVDGLINIARSYGIDLSPAFQGQTVQAPEQVQRLQHEIAQLKQELSQRWQQEDQVQTQATQAQLKEFAKDHPHFEDVRTMMASLIRDGHAETLQAAYDMAVNASPPIRERILADQRKAAEDKRKEEDSKREEEARRKAADAQKAARVNVRSSAAAQPNPRTMDDTIRETAARLYG
jgi:hypothetical protein